MRAVLFDGPGLAFRHVNMPEPVLQPGEVLVRVTLATVCGSDLHTIAGARQEPTPCVLGHEAVGVVEAMNGRVSTIDGEALAVGDRVVWTVAASCGQCFFCTHDLPQKCRALRKYGHTRHAEGRGPAGSFASHVHLWPGTGIVKVLEHVPDSVAAPAACATATVAACLRHLSRGENLLVVGCGMLGLTAIAMAKQQGWRVRAWDQNPERLAIATRYGAEEFTPEHGYDAALELTGSPTATKQALEQLRIGGTMILAGAVYPTPPLDITPEFLIRRCLTLHGVHNYAPQDLLEAVRFLASAGLGLESLVSRVWPLTKIDQAITFARQEKPFRVGLAPGS